MLDAPHYWLRYTVEKTIETKRGEKPANNRDYVLTEAPPKKDLVRFIAQHFTHTHRTLVLRGTGRGKAQLVTRAANALMPWQYKMTWQHADGSESWEAHFVCVGEWIQAGKYREFL